MNLADVAEKMKTLERDYENLKEQHKILANTKHKCVKENTELRTRVADAEEEVRAYRRSTAGEYEDRIKELQTRLSTLLKASEGMEKALEELSLYKAYNGDDWVSKKAKQALADFRAVKKTMEKGAGK